jgi:hypothetical protein
MATVTPRLRTPGIMAKELHVPLHRVVHVLTTRKHIQPSARAGTLRLYDRNAVQSLRITACLNYCPALDLVKG